MQIFNEVWLKGRAGSKQQVISFFDAVPDADTVCKKAEMCIQVLFD